MNLCLENKEFLTPTRKCVKTSVAAKKKLLKGAYRQQENTGTDAKHR